MATLKDVAALAGVTVTTVSRVLNNRGYIAEKTRERVYGAMKQLNYRPNELARSLTKRRTSCIGVIVPSVAHPFFCKVAACLEQHAARSGYKIMLCNSQHQRDKELDYLDMLRSNKVAGIVLCSRTADIEKELETDFPVVAFEREAGGRLSSVSCDNYQGGELATLRLLDGGCRYLLHISGSHGVPMPADKRRAAFEEVCRGRHIDFLVADTLEAQFNAMDYTDFIEQLLREHPEIDGVFASSDVIAAEVIQACARLKKQIPGELQIVGFDDTDLASLTTPAITTVRQPIDEMCRCAVDLIVKQTEGGAAASRTTFAVSLVERGTTKAPGRADGA